MGKSRQQTRGRGTTKSKRNHRIGLSAVEEHRLRRRLRLSACSEPWVDQQIKTLHDRTSDGRTILCRFFDPQAFPPGGRDGTAMRWCRQCGRYTPPNSIGLIEHRRARAANITSATLVCDDCRIAHDEQRFGELYEAGLFLRPAGSSSFVRMADLLKRAKAE